MNGQNIGYPNNIKVFGRTERESKGLDRVANQRAWTAGADPGFQVRGGVPKQIAPSGGRRENIWGISCEK